jgi:sortase A
VRRFLRGLGWTMISLGAFTLYFLVYQLVGTNALTGRAQASLRDELSEQWSAAPRGQQSRRVIRAPEKPVAAGKAFAIIRIPKIGVEQVLVEGTSRSNLRKGPGRISTSKMPGQAGAFAISGHRTTYGAPFFHLDRLKRGDQILIQTKNATYVYTVSRTRIVLPTETSVLRSVRGPDGKLKPTIVVTTCHPRFSAKERLIVFGDLTDTRAAPGSVSA